MSGDREEANDVQRLLSMKVKEGRDSYSKKLEQKLQLNTGHVLSDVFQQV